MLPEIDYIALAVGLMGLIVALLILAMLRNNLVTLFHAAFELLAMPFAIPARAINQLIHVLNHWIDETVDGLAYSRSGERAIARPSSEWIGWDIIGPLIYLFWFILLAAGDFWFSALGFAALLRIPAGLPKLPINLDILAGFLFVGVAAFYGFMLYDIYGATPIRRPWENFAERQRTVLKRIGFSAIFLVCLAGVAFWVWRELQVSSAEPPEPLSTILALVLWSVLAILLAVAAALAGWAAFVSWGSIYCVALMTLRVGLYLILSSCHVVVRLLDGIAALIVAILDVPAGCGIGLWNWLCSFRWAMRLHLDPIETISRPVVGRDLAEPLIERVPA